MATEIQIPRVGRGPSRFSVCLPVLGLCAWLLPCAPVHAQGPELQVRMGAPDHCPDGEALADRTASLLGRPLLEQGTPTLRVEVRVTREGGDHVLQLRSEGHGGADQRTLRAKDCDALVDAAALVIALTLDPAAPALEPRPPSTPPASPPSRDTHLEALAFVAGTFDAGSLPAPTAGVAGGLAVAWRRLQVALGVRWLPPRIARSEGRTARVQLAAATLRTCGRLTGPGSFGLSLCADGEAGRLVGQGKGGVDPGRRGRGPWAAAGGSVLARLRPVARWSLSVSAGALGVLTRPRLVVQDTAGGPSDVLHRPSAVAGRVDLQWEVWF